MSVLGSLHLPGEEQTFETEAKVPGEGTPHRPSGHRFPCDPFFRVFATTVLVVYLDGLSSGTFFRRVWLRVNHTEPWG